MGNDDDADRRRTLLTDWFEQQEKKRLYKGAVAAANDLPPDGPYREDTGVGMVHYASGAVRSAGTEHCRYDLISPHALERIAMTYAEGAAKYGDRNWEKGMPICDLMNHALSHIANYLKGEDQGGEDHLAHAAWNLMAIMHFEAVKPERPR
jgi:hypothetical protein